MAELLKAKQEFEILSTAESRPTDPIDIGALLTLRRGKIDTVYLLGPKAGGLEITHGETLVTVITPQSPLGRQLMGKAQGESVVFPHDPSQELLRIERVW